MRFSCQDLDAMMRDPEPERVDSMTEHLRACDACRSRWESWNELSVAARSLRRDWESPQLWPGIRRQLLAESQHPPAGNWLALHWRPLAALAALVLVSVVSIRTLMMQVEPAEPLQRRLLTEQALEQIEAAEEAYSRSIENLSRLVEPRLEATGSPLMLNYREKLLLIDAAIAECRTQIENNRFNAHLRTELLSMYQEKQGTLRALLKEDDHGKN